MNFFNKAEPLQNAIDAIPSSPIARQYGRRVLHANARLFVADMMPIDVRTLDLSQGGMAIIAPFNPEAYTGGSIRFPLKFTGSPLVHLEAMATMMNSVYSGHYQGFRIGMQFNDLSDKVKSLIVRYIESD